MSEENTRMASIKDFDNRAKEISIPSVADLTHLPRSLKSKGHSSKWCTPWHLVTYIRQKVGRALQWHAILEIKVLLIYKHDLHLQLTKDFLFLEKVDKSLIS